MHQRDGYMDNSATANMFWDVQATLSESTNVTVRLQITHSSRYQYKW
jgi:hypothetical protein